MNDSLRTNVFVRFQPETIACACIYLAARALQASIQSAVFYKVDSRSFVTFEKSVSLNHSVFDGLDSIANSAPLVSSFWYHRRGDPGNLHRDT